MSDRYPEEKLNAEVWPEDDGTMPNNVATLSEAVVGHKIVSAEQGEVEDEFRYWSQTALILTLDDGTKVEMLDTDDCCAYTSLNAFLLDPASVDHIITGIGTTEKYTVWHIYADWGDILRLELGWSCGNPFWYGYGFDIRVKTETESIDEQQERPRGHQDVS